MLIPKWCKQSESCKIFNWNTGEPSIFATDPAFHIGRVSMAFHTATRDFKVTVNLPKSLPFNGPLKTK